MEVIEKSFNKRHEKIYKSINKSHVILQNYLTACEISFTQFNCGHNHTLSDRLSKIMKAKNITGFAENTICELRKGKTSALKVENEMCIRSYVRSSGMSHTEVSKLPKFAPRTVPFSLLNKDEDNSKLENTLGINLGLVVSNLSWA